MYNYVLKLVKMESTWFSEQKLILLTFVSNENISSFYLQIFGRISLTQMWKVVSTSRIKHLRMKTLQIQKVDHIF